MRRATQLFFRNLSAAIMARAASRDRRTTSRTPVGLAPDPAATPEAVVQVYGARCSGWLGYFGVHTWIAVKPSGARAYTVYEVIDWRLRRSGSAVAIRKRAPDARWFGHTPELLGEKRGDGFQLSLFGLLGVLASGVEGFEVNVLGLAFGIDPFSPALRLPLVGRFGAARSNGAGIPVSIPAGPS